MYVCMYVCMYICMYAQMVVIGAVCEQVLPGATSWTGKYLEYSVSCNLCRLSANLGL